MDALQGAGEWHRGGYFSTTRLGGGEAKNGPQSFAAGEQAVAHRAMDGGGRNARFRKITIQRAIDFLLSRFQIRRELHRARMCKAAGADATEKGDYLVCLH